MARSELQIFMSGLPFSSISWCENSLMNPQEEEHYVKGKKLYDEKEYTDAILELTQAEELNPKHDNVYFYRAACYEEMEDYSKAVEDYSKMVDLHPNDDEWYCKRGNCYYKLNDFPTSIEEYSKGIKLNPENSGAYYNRGTCFYNLKNYEAAYENYSKARELNPEEYGENNKLLTPVFEFCQNEVEKMKKEKEVEELKGLLKENDLDSYTEILEEQKVFDINILRGLKLDGFKYMEIPLGDALRMIEIFKPKKEKKKEEPVESKTD